MANRKEEDFELLGSDEKRKLKISWGRIKSLKTRLLAQKEPMLALFDDPNLNNAKVLKVKFSNGNNQQHSYVDPWLLLMKNAVMLSDMVGLKLLPGCEFEASEDEDSASSDDEDGSVLRIPGTISFAATRQKR